MNLNIYYQNVRGLNTKIGTFYSSASECQFEIICLTETWLSYGISSSELFSHSYNVLRCDRQFEPTGLSRGGGVLIATKSDIQFFSVDLSEFHINFPIIDIIGKKYFLQNTTFYIFTLYIPPNIIVQELEQFFEQFELFLCNLENVVIMGDFNVPHYITGDVDAKSQILRNFIEFLSFEQHNGVPNESGRILDLVLSKIRCHIFHDNVPLVTEDKHHPALFISLSLSTQHHNSFPVKLSHKCYNFKKANFPGLYNELFVTDWTFLTEFNSINLACDAFYTKFYAILDNHVPQYITKKKQISSMV